MRFVIYGAGAIGGTIAVRLAQHGHEVVVIARGAHGAAIRERGLRLVSPDDEIVMRLPVVEPASVRAGDVVVLAMKTQDTVAALAALPPTDVTIACAQNAVANERMALRRFARVVAIYVWTPTSLLTPGVVEVSCAPQSGVLDVGCYPSGVDEHATAIAAALTASTFDSVARPDIMRWKYNKLLSNLGNAIEAATGPITSQAAIELDERACEEGRSVLRAAGIAFVSDEEVAARLADRIVVRPIAGRERLGGSSWQSLARTSGSIEADYLNGEIVLLGRTFGVPTPINAGLQRVANRLARDHARPGSLTVPELLAQLS